MLSVGDARARILSALVATNPEIVALTQAAGRVTAHAVTARLDQPAHDVSAMDGYALHAADTAAGTRLTVIGAAPAGHPFAGVVRPGEALRLFTGSVMPAGADAVLAQENAARDGDIVTAVQPVEPGRHVRTRGGDFASGDTLIEAGVRLGARAIGLAASAGHPWLSVHRRPVVALLATGDEIVMPGEPIPPGGLPGSNSFALAALVWAAGGEPLILPVARDDVDAIAQAAAGTAHADLLVTIGGASVGDHDLVRPALAERGFEVDFWKIAMRPGKPLMHGALRFGAHRVPVIGLPGNPVSALVCAALFVRPAIARLLGLAVTEPPRQRMRLAVPLGANDARADHLRATVTSTDGERTVVPMPVQDSSRLRDLTRADALIVRAPHDPAVPAGGLVDVMLLAELGV